MSVTWGKRQLVEEQNTNKTWISTQHLRSHRQ